MQYFCHGACCMYITGPDWKVSRMHGDLSFIKINWWAVFMSCQNRPIVFFCCFMKILWLELQQKFKLHSREIGCARQTFKSSIQSV